jgi:hypothetical protein
VSARASLRRAWDLWDDVRTIGHGKPAMKALFGSFYESATAFAVKRHSRECRFHVKQQIFQIQKRLNLSEK